MTTPNIPTSPEGVPSNIQAQQAAAHTGISEGVQQAVRKQVTGPKRDELVKATRNLTKPAGKKNIANDPLQSDFIGEPAEPPSATGGYPFPKPGLAYYMAEAMVINVQADANMMMAYNSEQNVFYKSIENQWDVFAQKDQEFYEQEGQKAIVGASFAVASATLAIGMAAYMGGKSAEFSSKQTALTGEKAGYTAQLGEETALATSVSGDEEAIEAEAGQEGAESPAEISQARRTVRADHEALVNQLENEKALSSNPEDFSEDEANRILDGKYDRLKEEVRATAERNLEPAYADQEAGNISYDELMEQVGDENADMTGKLAKLDGAKAIELDRVQNGESVDADADYDKLIEKAGADRDVQLEELDEKAETFKMKREDVSDKISALEKERGEHGTKMMSLQAIPNVVGQLAGLGTGVISITQQASTVKSRDTADKIKSINQTALQGLIRQWNTLAGYVDQSFPAYVDAIKSFNQALQRV